MINSAHLIGRLGKDPIARFTPNQVAVTNFTIATDSSYSKDGERHKRTDWHNIVTFGKIAEAASNYLKKGRLVYVEGRLQTRSWDDKDGIKRYTTEIVASEVKFLDSSSNVAPPPEDPGYAGSISDDDIPF